MKRLILGLVCACCCLSGCELLEHDKRSKSGDQPHEHEQAEETDSVGAVKSAAPKNFFFGSRLPGALSSDARDIERSLGVP
ncbi:hypothetical protein V5E97_28845 [Singulisphaera sp. Ch08]|uniref:Lipoprotein n=1 Tax=Singulisphaera sp. Ch08 TaxID=3120278 RepID=A0AAU7CBH9_9BACT